MSRHTVPADVVAPYRTGTGAGRDSGTPAPQVLRALQVYLPEIYPIPGSIEFNLLSTAASAGAGSGAFTGVTLNLPRGMVGVIRSVGIFTNDMLDTTNVNYFLNIDGGGVGGFAPLQIFPRVATSVSNTLDAMIRIPDGAAVTGAFTNIDGGTYLLGMSISGWYYSQDLAARWIAQGP